MEAIIGEFQWIVGGNPAPANFIPVNCRLPLERLQELGVLLGADESATSRVKTKSVLFQDSVLSSGTKFLKLKDLMKKIIYLGNTLNQGTAKGAAVGFKLDSLLKLTDTRASTSRMTLMHLSFQGLVLAAKKPALLDFHLDFVSLEAATEIQLKALAEEMQAIIKGLEKVKQELAASENDGPVSEVFHKVHEKPTTLDCVQEQFAKAHNGGSYLYKCIWEALQQMNKNDIDQHALDTVCAQSEFV
ncbi:putative formin-like protein 15b [Gossypium arboreum]|uniref:putative formin-like protein 15b n=1 Tax=Gossypium arboreum TaxID=29729 RepID=UPI0022F1C38B|nr:putative formin-like protein 15b [Gossypium arboreum]